MHLQWLGEGGIKITTKDATDQKITIIIDPPATTSGMKIRGGIQGDMVALSREEAAPNIAVPDPRYCLDRPGEYEIKSIPLLGRAVRKGTIWRTDIEGIRMVHMGALEGELNEAERAFCANAEVLMVPVGGHGVLSPKEAAELVRTLEPSLVIPLYYHTEGLSNQREDIERFVKELPCPQERSDKVSLRRSDLPSEGMKMYIITL